MMMHNQTRGARSSGRAVSYLAADHKKTVVAVGLVVLMGFMWLRVLTGGKPQSAAAAKPSEKTLKQAKPFVNVRFHSLPIIPGRNDNINHNFFAVENWSVFSKELNRKTAGTDSEVRVVAPDRTQEVIVQMARRIKLEAVLWSENPQIFVNDQLLHVGDTIELQDGADTYVFEVVRIEADSVLVRCREQQLTLKLAQSNDVSR